MTAAPHSRGPDRVRPATAADAGAVIAVVNAAFAIETFFLEGTRTDERRLEAMMRSGEFLVVEDQDGRIVGSVYIAVQGEDGCFRMLAVDPARQGDGLGRVLVEAAETYGRVRGCTRMEIDVLNLRTELLPFYRKFGYAETGAEAFHPLRPLRAGVECYRIILSKGL
jgi:GNAT superfamily N-acetyltransferase